MAPLKHIEPLDGMLNAGLLLLLPTLTSLAMAGQKKGLIKEIITD